MRALAWDYAELENRRKLFASFAETFERIAGPEVRDEIYSVGLNQPYYKYCLHKVGNSALASSEKAY